MIKFALCGNIASGKSTVQKFLECNGYKVLDTDCVAHKLLTVKNKALSDLLKNGITTGPNTRLIANEISTGITT